MAIAPPNGKQAQSIRRNIHVPQSVGDRTPA